MCSNVEQYKSDLEEGEICSSDSDDEVLVTVPSATKASDINENEKYSEHCHSLRSVVKTVYPIEWRKPFRSAIRKKLLPEPEARREHCTGKENENRINKKYRRLRQRSLQHVSRHKRKQSLKSDNLHYGPGKECDDAEKLASISPGHKSKQSKLSTWTDKEDGMFLVKEETAKEEKLLDVDSTASHSIDNFYQDIIVGALPSKRSQVSKPGSLGEMLYNKKLEPRLSGTCDVFSDIESACGTSNRKMPDGGSSSILVDNNEDDSDEDELTLRLHALQSAMRSITQQEDFSHEVDGSSFNKTVNEDSCPNVVAKKTSSMLFSYPMEKASAADVVESCDSRHDPSDMELCDSSGLEDNVIGDIMEEVGEEFSLPFSHKNADCPWDDSENERSCPVQPDTDGIKCASHINAMQDADVPVSHLDVWSSHHLPVAEMPNHMFHEGYPVETRENALADIANFPETSATGSEVSDNVNLIEVVTGVPCFMHDSDSYLGISGQIDINTKITDFLAEMKRESATPSKSVVEEITPTLLLTSKSLHLQEKKLDKKNPAVEVNSVAGESLQKESGELVTQESVNRKRKVSLGKSYLNGDLPPKVLKRKRVQSASKDLQKENILPLKSVRMKRKFSGNKCEGKRIRVTASQSLTGTGTGSISVSQKVTYNNIEDDDVDVDLLRAQLLIGMSNKNSVVTSIDQSAKLQKLPIIHQPEVKNATKKKGLNNPVVKHALAKVMPVSSSQLGKTESSQNSAYKFPINKPVIINLQSDSDSDGSTEFSGTKVAPFCDTPNSNQLEGNELSVVESLQVPHQKPTKPVQSDIISNEGLSVTASTEVKCHTTNSPYRDLNDEDKNNINHESDDTSFAFGLVESGCQGQLDDALEKHEELKEDEINLLDQHHLFFESPPSIDLKCSLSNALSLTTDDKTASVDSSDGEESSNNTSFDSDSGQSSTDESSDLSGDEESMANASLVDAEDELLLREKLLKKMNSRIHARTLHETELCVNVPDAVMSSKSVPDNDVALETGRISELKDHDYTCRDLMKSKQAFSEFSSDDFNQGSPLEGKHSPRVSLSENTNVCLDHEAIDLVNNHVCLREMNTQVNTVKAANIADINICVVSSSDSLLVKSVSQVITSSEISKDHFNNSEQCSDYRIYSDSENINQLHNEILLEEMCPQAENFQCHSDISDCEIKHLELKLDSSRAINDPLDKTAIGRLTDNSNKVILINSDIKESVSETTVNTGNVKESMDSGRYSELKVDARRGMSVPHICKPSVSDHSVISIKPPVSKASKNVSVVEDADKSRFRYLPLLKKLEMEYTDTQKNFKFLLTTVTSMFEDVKAEQEERKQFSALIKSFRAKLSELESKLQGKTSIVKYKLNSIRDLQTKMLKNKKKMDVLERKTFIYGKKVIGNGYQPPWISAAESKETISRIKSRKFNKTPFTVSKPQRHLCSKDFSKGPVNFKRHTKFGVIPPASNLKWSKSVKGSSSKLQTCVVKTQKTFGFEKNPTLMSMLDEPQITKTKTSIKELPKATSPSKDVSDAGDRDILCPYDLLGRCNDDSCIYKHLTRQKMEASSGDDQRSNSAGPASCRTSEGDVVKVDPGVVVPLSYVPHSLKELQPLTLPVKLSVTSVPNRATSYSRPGNSLAPGQGMSVVRRGSHSTFAGDKR